MVVCDLMTAGSGPTLCMLSVIAVNALLALLFYSEGFNHVNSIALEMHHDINFAMTTSMPNFYYAPWVITLPYMIVLC